MSKTLDKLRKDINKEYERQGLPAPICEPNPVEFITTGFKTLDDILGGGWAIGKLIELWGVPGCGKTTLTLQTIAKAQSIGQNCVFIDVERAFNPLYARILGVDTEKLIYIKPDYAEQALELAYKYAESGEVKLIVLDSVASLLGQDTKKRDFDQKEQASLARILSRSIPKLIPVLDNNKCSFIFINQIRHKVGMMFGNPETTPGGETLKFGSFMRVELRHIEFVKKGDEKIGDMVKATAKKTKAKEPHKIAMLRMDFGTGFNVGYDLLQSKILLGEITKAGAWYLYGEKKLQGEEAMISCLVKELTNDK